MVSKILLWLQERIKLWTKPATSILIIGILSDLARNRTDLVVENALLRQQLIVLNRQVKTTSANQLYYFIAAHAVCFIIIQPSIPFWFTYTQNPIREVSPFDPDMPCLIIKMRRTCNKPIAEGSIGNPNCIRKLAHRVKHR